MTKHALILLGLAIMLLASSGPKLTRGQTLRDRFLGGLCAVLGLALLFIAALYWRSNP